MLSFREKELQAQRLKESAKAFVDAHHCGPRDSSKPLPTRDNTFDILRTSKVLPSAPPTISAPNVPQTQETGQTPSSILPEGWERDDEHARFFHSFTGCATNAFPKSSIGKGLCYWKPLPRGWKLVKHSVANEPSFYFWNPTTQEKTFVFPIVTSVKEEKPESLESSRPESNKNDNNEEVEEEEEEIHFATQPLLPRLGPKEKKAKLAIFDEE